MNYTSFFGSLSRFGFRFLKVVLEVVILAFCLIPTWFWLIAHAIVSPNGSWGWINNLNPATGILCGVQILLFAWATHNVFRRWW